MPGQWFRARRELAGWGETMASELLGSNLFASVYKATSDSIKAKDFARADPWSVLIPRLATLCGENLEPAHASVLDDFRTVAAEKTPKAGSHGKFMASAAGMADGTAPTAAQLGLIAGLKVLFHTYHHSTKGQGAVWIVSIPVSYTTWPHKQLCRVDGGQRHRGVEWRPNGKVQRPQPAGHCPGSADRAGLDAEGARPAR